MPPILPLAVRHDVIRSTATELAALPEHRAASPFRPPAVKRASLTPSAAIGTWPRAAP
jgi:hypothetical protein